MVRFVVVALLAGTLVACEGEQGPQGEQGPAGPAPGAVSNRYCSKRSNNLLYEYQVVRFTTGDLMATCSVADIVSEHSSTIYYRAGDSGTATGLCWVFYDADVPNGGSWNFRMDAPGERAVYNDPTSASHGYVLTFAAEDCVG